MVLPGAGSSPPFLESTLKMIPTYRDAPSSSRSTAKLSPEFSTVSGLRIKRNEFFSRASTEKKHALVCLFVSTKGNGAILPVRVTSGGSEPRWMFGEDVSDRIRDDDYASRDESLICRQV